MATTSFAAPTVEHLMTTRRFPQDLAEYFAANGFRHLDEPAAAHILREGFDLGGAIVTYPTHGLLIPYHDLDGQPLRDRRGYLYQRVRCYPHAVHANGGTPKYEAPAGSSNHLSIPPGAVELALSIGLLIITEGEIKAWVAMYHDLPTVAIPGVSSWKGSRGGKLRIDKPDGSHDWGKNTGPVPELEALPWAEMRERGTVVVIAFDSDARTKPQVAQAQKTLAKHIREAYGVEVRIASLPDQANGDKNGLDDYILSKGAVAARELMMAARPSLKSWKKPRKDGEEMRPASELVGVAIEEMHDDELEAHIVRLGERMGQFDDGSREQYEAADDLRAAKREIGYRRALAEYGLQMRGTPYAIEASGVYRASRGGKDDPTIATRPIWPSKVARDVATGETFVEVTWEDARHDLARKWLPHRALSDRGELFNLDGANVTAGRVNKVSDWLGDATGYLEAARKAAKVTSRTGWVDIDGSRRFILPGDPEVEFIYPVAKPRGTVQAWAEGLRLLVAMGEAGFTGLACVGLAAAAPLARVVGLRNPILGIVAASSKGKSSVLAYAMSVWSDPRGQAVIGAGSTHKGIEDVAMGCQDLPIFIDEIQRIYLLDPRKAESALYFLGNGKRRTTSSKAQVARGGEDWHGVGFYAAEHSIMGGLADGAQVRVVELDGPPLQSRPDAERLQALALANWGAVAAALAEQLPALATDAQVAIPQGAAHFSSLYPNLRGDEAATAAAVAVGLSLLAEVTGLSLPAAAVAGWLAARAAAVRAATKDRTTLAFEALVQTVLGGDWTGDQLTDGADVIAWKGMTGRGRGCLDINPQARRIEAALREYGGAEIHLPAWLERGWLVSGENGNRKVKRADFGPRVFRVSAAYLDEAPAPAGEIIPISAHRAEA